MPILKLNDIELYYETIGSGQPLMLIAGLASDSQSWQPLVEELSRHYQLILLDNRGVGRTQPHSAPSSIEQMADDCIALADYLGIQQFSLVGHSMGGMIALSCASRHPKRINRLMLLATAIQNPSRNNQLFQDWLDYWRVGLPLDLWFRNVFFWIFSPDFFNHSETIKAAVEFALTYPHPQSLVGFERQIQALANANLEPQLALITQPTLIICAEVDLLFPIKESAPMLRLLPNHQLVIVEGAAHSLVVEQPKTIQELLLKFLNSYELDLLTCFTD